MAGLLDGLASLGLGNLENAKVFEEPKKEEKSEETSAPKIEEKDLIYDRTYECPVCEKKITSKVLKSSKTKLLRTDMDMRPVYDGVDFLKYDVVLCPHCGFSALNRYFKPLISVQVKMIKENISDKVRLQPHEGDVYTYEEALERYRLALACAIVKQAKPSEKAYVCLKAAWLLRGWSESLDSREAGCDDKKKELLEQEMEFLKSALDGFISARETESFPVCGMDEYTVDFLIAVLATRFKRYDLASKLIATILVSNNAHPRMKDKARELKEIIMQEIRKSKKV